MSEPSQLPHERRGAAFLVLLIAIGLAAVASLLLSPLEQLLPPGLEVPRIALLFQPALLLVGCALLGWWAAPKVGLDAPVLGGLLEKGDWTGALRGAVILGLAGAIAAGLVLVVFGLATAPYFAGQQAEMELPMLTRVAYGGIGEEIISRWGVMSLVALIALKLGLGRLSAQWTGNALAALLFALGHLPALFALVDPPGWLLAAVIAGNVAAGLIFGWLFMRRGLESAMIAHAGAHLLAVPVLTALG